MASPRRRTRTRACAGFGQLIEGSKPATAEFDEAARIRMATKDLRDWIGGIAAAGELKVITGAEPREEIGGIVDIYMRRMGNPAVMFDEVPGFPKGHRVIANILTSIP